METCDGGSGADCGARGDGYPAGFGVSGHQRRYLVPVCFGRVHSGVQAGEPVAVQEVADGCVDGGEVRGEGNDSDCGDAEAEEAGGTGTVDNLYQRLISHIDAYVVLYGAIAVAAFWFAIQLGWSVMGKQWYSVMWRVLAALGLVGVGFVMIFFTAFGAN
jgi:hypothetical protein